MTGNDVFVFPASFGQERLWLLDELGAGAAYHVAGALRLTGELDEEILRRSLQLLLDRHEALRTGVELSADGTVVQVAMSALAVPLRTEEVQQEQLESAIRAVIEEPFHLGAPPLLRVALLRITGAGHRVLVLCVHHIVVDGWSLGILMTELGAAYAALAAGREPELPQPQMQYADFAVWQREHLTDEVRTEQLAHWRTALSGVSALELVTDHPRGEATGYRGGSVRTVLPRDLLEGLHATVNTEHATDFMVYLAAWAVVLSRWSAQSDLVIGTPVAGRPSTELDGVVGFFVNTLPLRIRLDPHRDLRALLRHTRTVCLAALAHQDVPYEQIKQAVNAPGMTLPQAMLGLQNTHGGRLRLPGVEVEQLPLRRESAQSDLSLDLAGTADGELAVELTFRGELFGLPSAGRLLDGFRTVLHAFAEHLDRPVWTVPVMGAEQRDRVLRMLSGAADISPARGDVVAWFEATVDASPEAVAVVADDTGETLTYRELDTEANRLAAWLRAQGMQPEDRVGVCLHRGTSLAVALLGVLKAGAVYQPLDPDHPGARLQAMISEGQPVVVLTTAAFRAAVSGAKIADLDEIADEIAAQPARRRPVRLPHGGAAYVVFTSGSTGRPKGAINTREGLANRLCAIQDRIGLTPGDVVVQKTPIGFDVSLPELLSPLVTGAQLVFAVPGGHRDPGYLWELFARRGITSTHFVPSMLRAFLDAAPVDPRLPLRHVLCSGEELTAGLVADLASLLPGIRLHNLYGPAEASVEVTYCAVAADQRGRVPIGGPVPGVELYVLDRFGEPVPVGVPGELHIGGVQLGQGYVNRPGHTAERFVPNPFGSGTRLYATGDRVRWTENGELEFLGRLDFQVQIRGQRVEPGEIEAVLRTHPAVADAVVLVRTDQYGQPALVGYVTEKNSLSASAEELRGYLADRLPSAMVPAHVVSLAAFPVTPNGKADRSALPEPSTEARDRPPVAPRTPLETMLIRLWSEVLGVRDIGIQDDFYQLGGDSLRAMHVLQRTRRMDLRIPLSVLLGHHTIEQLASLDRHSQM